MSFVEEFSQQWNSLANYIESDLISQIQNRSAVNPVDISQKFENEKMRWFVPGQYNYAWFQMLREKHPDIAQQFEAELRKATLKINVSQERPSESPIWLSTVIGAVLCGVLGFFIRTWIGALICMLGGGIIGRKIGTFFFEKKLEEAHSAQRALYKKELNSMRTALKAIVEKADS